MKPEKLLGIFEKCTMNLLILLGVFFVIYQIAGLCVEFIHTIKLSFETNSFFPEGSGKAIGAKFFSILLTMEIIETVRVFRHNSHEKIRLILLVGLTAATRKILLLDAVHGTPLEEIATSIMVIALALGYYWVSRQQRSTNDADGTRDY